MPLRILVEYELMRDVERHEKARDARLEHYARRLGIDVYIEFLLDEWSREPLALERGQDENGIRSCSLSKRTSHGSDYCQASIEKSRGE